MRGASSNPDETFRQQSLVTSTPDLIIEIAPSSSATVVFVRVSVTLTAANAPGRVAFLPGDGVDADVDP
jgi:hypothetical protein